ncbi:MAG: hypothetical protein Q9218_001863 [Villophora microphyllina]
MSRPLSSFLQAPFLFLTTASHLSLATALPKDIWHISIFEGPAPSRENGPPLSANSLRNPSYLPAQIGAIVAAYILSVLVISSGLLFVGRRLRRAAQASPRTLAMEMVKPVRPDVSKAFDPSPISPSPATKNPYGPSPSSTIDMKNNWPSPEKSCNSVRWPSVKGHGYQPSIQSSVVTFDESVIEEDKARNQSEMERLYAAVMEHDELKSSGSLPPKDASPPQHPPELQHLRANALSSCPASPPPQYDSSKSPARTLTTSPRKSIRPSPIMTHSRNSSRSSFGSFNKKRGIRNLAISPPMGSPDLVPDNLSRYSETEPLSPRLYNPGPPPPTPPAREAQAQKKHPESYEPSLRSPFKTSFRESTRTPRTSIPAFQTVPESTHEHVNLPQSSDPATKPPTLQLPKSKRAAPAPLHLQTQASSGSTGVLPLRSAPLPFRNLNSSRGNADRPPSMIKATVLERKVPDKHLLGTPRTGVPMTPYSPYMPFTPLTPMTPSRLVTREERKQREKEEGRRVMTVEDRVVEEDEVWGDAY